MNNAGQSRSFEVPEGFGEMRADKFVALQVEDISRQKLQESFDAGSVTCGGAVIRKKARVQAGDVLTVVLPEVKPISIEPVEMPLDVLYEDDDIVIINKVSGIIVHPGNGVHEPTLVHGLLHYTKGKLAQAAGAERLGVVHRLDRDTSGAIIFAKTDVAYYKLVQMFSERCLHKEYHAIVVGIPKAPFGSIELPIGRSQTNRTKMCVSENGKKAHTDWTVLETFGYQYALIQCRIHTGRTHQIRVHLSHMHHPIWGDRVYGYRPKKDEKNPPTHFLLHARYLAFEHPCTGKKIEIEAPFSQEFQRRLIQLRQLKP